MKAQLQKLVGLMALGMTLLTTPVPTWAGWVFTPGVSVYRNDFGWYAKGSLVGTRYSADRREAIGCAVDVVDRGDSLDLETFCFAEDTAGQGFNCRNTDPKFQEVVQAMTDSSSIYIQTDTTGTVCTDIRIYHGSERLR